MADIAAPAWPYRIPSQALIGCFGMTFAITWCLIGVYFVAPDWASAGFGEISGSHPVVFLATWAPALSAIAVVLIHGDRPGLRSFLSRLLMWRGSPGWTLFILPTGIFYAQGVKTNVLFFTRNADGSERGGTDAVWVYDMRAGAPSYRKTRPLRVEDFAAFEVAFDDDPLGGATRIGQGE